MPKKSKLSTPDWIKEGYSSKADYEKAKGIDKKKSEGKTFTVRECPKCKSNDIGVVIGGTIGMWECRKCGFKSPSFLTMELGEDDFLKYMGEKQDGK